MDWADDITYAVHDLEDFWRAGIVPLELIASDGTFRKEALEQLVSDGHVDEGPHTDDCWSILASKLPTRPFSGDSGQLRELYANRSEVISYLAGGSTVIEVDGRPVHRIEEHRRTMANLLKGLTRVWVIDGAHLAPQREGQTRIIEGLFDVYHQAASQEKSSVLMPSRFQEPSYSANTDPSRIAADYISSLAEPAARSLHGRLFGYDLGSLSEVPIGA